MKIKYEGQKFTSLSQFDLLSKNEIGLSSAFAYLLGKEESIFYSFLNYLGLDLRKISKDFTAVTIEKEKAHIEGRTDIEIHIKNELFIVIECKVNSNKLGEIRHQYNALFKDKKEKIKILCFITQNRDSNIEFDIDKKTINADWGSIIKHLSNNTKKELQDNYLLRDFINFATKNFKVNMKDEILIQDLSKEDEMTLFLKYQIYRRTEFGVSPLYFAPYFTRESSYVEGDGIFFLSKIIRIFRFCTKDIENYRSDLERISPDNSEKWIEGVKAFIKEENDPKQLTYYFLDKPMKFSSPLRKVKNNISKGWIGSNIPPNRTVSVTEFISHIPNINQ